MRITSKGQVTIPLTMRRRFGLLPNTEVEFEAGEDGVLIRPARSGRDRFELWLKKAAGSANSGLTTDQIMQLTRGED
jgi:AbrB family looped-hinge helix DNA binding protein